MQICRKAVRIDQVKDIDANQYYSNRNETQQYYSVTEIGKESQYKENQQAREGDDQVEHRDMTPQPVPSFLHVSLLHGQLEVMMIV